LLHATERIAIVSGSVAKTIGMTAWRSCNGVTLRWARLVMGWGNHLSVQSATQANSAS